MIPIIFKSVAYGNKTAIIDAGGVYTYHQLQERAKVYAASLSVLLGPQPGPVLFLVPSGFTYVALQWGIWLAGGIAVPVHTEHPAEEIRYLAADTGSRLLLYEASFAEKAHAAGSGTCRVLDTLLLPAGDPALSLPATDMEADALMIYTSGTTGRPKGVVMSHRQLDLQMQSLSQAWDWTAADRILNILPMHHVHGVINITCCALYNGAILEMRAGFDAAHVAARMTSGDLSLFMAVPTIYHKLIQHFETLLPAAQHQWQQGMRSMRLMVSGSAALPVTVLERWQAISGHVLLERYGMTEIGMALSNPLEGLRRPGYVGIPLPFVSVKLVDEAGGELQENNEAGELYVRGGTVFQRYWNRPEETARSFEDGWFKTGDIAARDNDGYYKILGRSSSDIIKSGGYKISALEIENIILEYSGVQECAVVALPSEEWGEMVAAAIVGEADPALLKTWLKEKLAPYKVPRRFVQADTLPRNAMGKVLKGAVKALFI